MIKTHRLLAVTIAASLVTVLPTCFAASVTPEKLTSALHWRSVGHFVGGRVVAVTGVPQKPNLYYMGAVGGGVWKSDDYGLDWKNISDKYFDNSNIGAIAVAPSDPNVIYVGTGEPDIRNTLLTGDGMYKSSDAGKTWKKIGLADTQTISKIIVDPQNPDVVYASSMGHVFEDNPQRGVFKSTDGGQTWKKVLFVNAKTGVIDLTMDPTNPQVLYAATWEAFRKHWTFSSGGPGSGIYKSTDGGANWTNITHKQGLPTGIFGRVGLAIAPSNPHVMYAIVQGQYKDQAGGLFRSDDAGQSWKLVNNSMDLTQRAFYYSEVFVDPKDPDTLYLPQVEALWVSHDSGKTISKLKTPHGDNHALWINPDHPKIMIEANDGGATVTRDGGKNWSTEDNQPTGQFYHVNLDNQFPYHIYGSQQDEGSYTGPSAVASGGIPPVWTRVMGGESSWVVPQPGKPWITFASGYYSKFWKANLRTGLITSVSPWPAFKFGVAASKVKYRYDWTHHPILFAPHNPNELLVGANVVFQSMDDGATWKVISPDLTRNDKSKQKRPGGPISADVTSEESFDAISALAVSPLSDKVIWSGSDDGLVYVSQDGGGHWDKVLPTGMPEWATVTCIEPSHTEAGTAYVTASRYMWDDFKPYIYRTTDFGKHWTAISTGLPDNQYLESVREDPDAPNLLFAGTSYSVFMSLDAGARWLPLALNLPSVRVSDIAIQPEQHAVVLATHGRAFWTLDNLQFLEQLSKAQVDSDAAYLFKPQQTWLVTRATTGSAKAKPNEGTNLPPGATVFFHIPAGYDGKTPVSLAFMDAKGQLIHRFALHLKQKTPKLSAVVRDNQTPTQKKQAALEKLTAIKAGMNRFQWNLRYANAVDVKGIFNSEFSAGFPVGPEVVPGTYDAVLSYGEQKVTQRFTVKLDPTLSTTQAQLQQRFDLLMQLHTALNSLDTTLNRAIVTRAELEKAVADKKVSSGGARKALAALNTDIEDLVNLKIQSGEGALVYPGKLRSWLTSIAGDISLAFVPPSAAQTEVANMYVSQEKQGVSRLQADISQAQAVLKK